MKCIIIDDELLAIDVLSGYCKKLGFIEEVLTKKEKSIEANVFSSHGEIEEPQKSIFVKSEYESIKICLAEIESIQG